ncbi:hypothetical protein [Duganella sp. CF458]|uniref:hypothetical protein n=1 Tax=Duganella sp. CF458 TaxID=1884368 RepID=UPI000B82E138|nr:hypothetical protein [Duganella sp. CF458]
MLAKPNVIRRADIAASMIVINGQFFMDFDVSGGNEMELLLLSKRNVPRICGIGVVVHAAPTKG